MCDDVDQDDGGDGGDTGDGINWGVEECDEGDGRYLVHGGKENERREIWMSGKRHDDMMIFIS